MVRDTLIVSAFLLLNVVFLDITAEAMFSNLVGITSGSHTNIIVFLLVASVFLVFSSFLFPDLGLYRISYFFSKLLMELAQFLLVLLAIFNVWIWFGAGEDLLLVMGYDIVLMLFLLLTAAAYAIHLIDFNYEFKTAFTSHVGLILLSIIVVQVAGLF